MSVRANFMKLLSVSTIGHYEIRFNQADFDDLVEEGFRSKVYGIYANGKLRRIFGSKDRAMPLTETANLIAQEFLASKNMEKPSVKQQSLKEIYQESLKTKVTEHVEKALAACIDVATRAAKNALTSAECPLPCDFPNEARVTLIIELRTRYEITAQVNSDRDTDFVPVVSMRGWAD